MQPEVHIYPDNPAVASAFAEWLSEWIQDQGDRQLHIALSGGSTPQLLFEILAKEYADRIPWHQVHLYWGDERCVPPDHEESNFGVTQQLLLRHIDIPMANVHRVRGEADPAEEAERYAEVIREEISHAVDGIPVFDLIILGMGADGHTASIFPHQMKLLHSNALCAVATHPETGQKRITLTGPVIKRARQIAFLVTGKSKTEKVRQIIRQEEGWKAYPAAHIDPIDGQLDWYIDHAAADEL